MKEYRLLTSGMPMEMDTETQTVQRRPAHSPLVMRSTTSIVMTPIRMSIQIRSGTRIGTVMVIQMALPILYLARGLLDLR